MLKSSLSYDSLYGTERHSVKRQSHARAPHQEVISTTTCFSLLRSASLIDLSRHLGARHRSTRRHLSLQQTRTNFTFTAIHGVALAPQSCRPLMARSSKMEALNSSTIRPFENDDYDYLINCTDLITTCQEALQDNFERDCDQSSQSAKSGDHSKQTPECHNCDEHISIRSPSSAASSGLGLSLEEDSSLKYCHSDEEFSSLNSTSTESFSTKALVAEFIEWLDYAENQLDSVCYCAKIATSNSGAEQSAATSSNPRDDLADCHSANDRADNCPDVDNSKSNCANHEPSLGVNEQQHKVLGQNVIIDHEQRYEVNEDELEPTDDQDENDVEREDDYYEDEEEAEELMMSLRPETGRKSHNPTRTKLCFSETVADWSVILARYKAFQNEFEKIAHRFNSEIESIKPNCPGTSLYKSLTQLQNRCYRLWIKSIEYSVILTDTPGQRCPRHFFANATSRDKAKSSGVQHLHQSSNSALIRSSTSVFCASPLLPYRALLRNGHHHLPANCFVGKKVELKSTGTGGSSVSIHHRRVQTRSGSTMIEQEDQIVDTHSPDGSGSPSADSGVFSSGTEKYEIIQKDIGYSSDADMSDAIEAHPHLSDQTSLQRSARKRQVRRRRTRTARPRPWSYHADWTDWDYYQTPFACNGENASNEDMLNFDNENAVRKLTEFGENYETWINTELESDELKLLKPAVVIEKPEIEAYCEGDLVQKADASTSPIPFLDEEIDERDVHHRHTCAVQTIECKSTQTASKSVVDSGCMTNPQTEHGNVTSRGIICKACGSPTNSYSSIKFYTSLALAGLFAIFFAVTQFSPEIHKSYSRPPPI